MNQTQGLPSRTMMIERTLSVNGVKNRFESSRPRGVVGGMSRTPTAIMTPG